jgi:hypothetical protein
MWSPCCLCVCESTPINFLIPEPIFMKLGIYIMAPEPVSAAHFINPSSQSVSVCVSLFPCYATDRKTRSRGKEYMQQQKNFWRRVSVGLSLYSPIFVRQQLGKDVPAATNYC